MIFTIDSITYRSKNRDRHNRNATITVNITQEHIDANGYRNVGGVSFYKDDRAARFFELLTVPCKLQLNDLCLLFLYQITTFFSIFVSHLIYFITCIVLMKLRNK